MLFEAWRSPSHTRGAGGETDALSGYLSSEIMAGLAPREREFLITTAVLGTVTAQRAEAIGASDAAAVMAGLRAHHLPLTFTGEEMRCHPRFREYLQRRLQERDVAARARAARAPWRAAERGGPP